MMKREIEEKTLHKIAEALKVALNYFKYRDLMNAQIHTPDYMRASPITDKVNEAYNELGIILADNAAEKMSLSG